MPPVTVPQAFALAIQHHQAGRLAEAEAVYRQILGVDPNHADAWHMLGVVANQVGQRKLSAEWIRKSIALNPNNSEAHYNLGNTFKDDGHVDEAIAAFQRALALRPAYAEAANNLGVVLSLRGRFAEAIAICRRAVELSPNLVAAHYNLGNALKDHGALEEAVAAYRRGLELDPNLPQAHNNLGVALDRLGQYDQSIAVFHRALQLQPGFAEAENNLGAALYRKGQLDDAEAACHRALQLKPNFPDAHNNLGNIFCARGQVHEAVNEFRCAIEGATAPSGVHSSLLFTLHYVPDLDEKTIAAEHERWNQLFSAIRRAPSPPYSNDRDPSRRLRIGYISPDFLDHVVGHNLVPLFRHHDRENFEIFCYTSAAKSDHLTERFRQWSDHWRSTVGLSDEALAGMIRQDAIDILVDLAQHTSGNRLAAFAHKPAPVQVSFAGYPASTGLQEIAYRISDRWLEGSASEFEDGKSEIGRTFPPELRTPNSDPRSPIPDLPSPISHLRPAEQVSEIDSFWCYDPDGLEIAVNESPAAKTGGRIVFGSLNSFGKINASVLQLWAQILGQVKDSRLLLLSRHGSHQKRVRDFFEQEGIAGDRVEFVDRCPRDEYLRTFQRIDIGLDPFPYGGHTSSLDALWMGVPVISLCGHMPVSRSGLSILHNLGLPELVAHSKSQYLQIATDLAHDLPRLADLRANLRTRMEASVLMDAPHFTRQIEIAYRQMWRHWLQGEKSIPANSP
ncbi:MAG TPA: tetratricopeptide repeat protein [Chthoniobacter sp.]|jgi:predicted O-linked N-acetylglucosamine transferase (SPINDLY family)